MKQILVTIGVVVGVLLIIFFIGQTRVEERRSTGLLDRHDILMKEGDHLRTPGAYDSTIRYGEYEGKTQFYIEDEKGNHPLEDWSDRPQEEWSEIINK